MLISELHFTLQFTQDGNEECLSQTVHLNIAPMSTLFSASRRHSAAGDISNLHRGTSDTVVPQLAPRCVPSPLSSNLGLPLISVVVQVCNAVADEPSPTTCCIVTT